MRSKIERSHKLTKKSPHKKKNVAKRPPHREKSSTHNKKYHSGIRGIYITNTSTTMVFANEKNLFTTITVSRLLLPFP